jgi:hypothetical protein
LQTQVQGKTVAIKVNLTGANHFEGYTVGGHPLGASARGGGGGRGAGGLGARRIRILESAGSRRPDYKLEDKLLEGGWDVNAIRGAAPLVDFEDTNGLGFGKQYSALKVRTKPYIFISFPPST